MAVSKERRAELEHELARLQQVDEAIHRSMPVGGNANHEVAQQLIGDRIREIKKELS
jgi:50S ribosomal subunit-associated GTPase HflX